MNNYNPCVIGLAVSGLLFAMFSTACGGTGSLTQESSETVDPGAGSATASPAAQSELGVHRWESAKSGSDLSVRGFDESDTPVVEFHAARKEVDATHSFAGYELRIPTGAWSVVLALEERDSEHVAEIASNTFTDDPAATRALDIIGKDFDAVSSPVLAKSLQTQDLVRGDCVNLVSCVRIVGYDTEAAKACAWAGAVTTVNPAARNGALKDCAAKQAATREMHDACHDNFDGNHAVCAPKL